MKLRNAAGTVVDVADAYATRLRRAGWKPLEPGPAPPDPPPSPVTTVGELPSEKDALLAVADAEGVPVDRRWGIARLTETIRAARSS